MLHTQLNVYVGEDSTPSGVSAIVIPTPNPRANERSIQIVVLRNWQLYSLARQILSNLSE